MATKTQLKTELRQVETDVVENVTAATRARVQLSVLVSRGADLVESLGLHADWREWATTPRGKDGADGPLIPGYIVSVPSLYRLRNIGTVARYLGDDVGEASPDAIAPFYRVVAAKSDGKTTEEVIDTLRSLWAQGSNGSRTKEWADATLEEAGYAPTRGKGAGDVKATSENRKAATERKAAKTKTTAKTAVDEPNVAQVESETGSADREACMMRVNRSIERLPDSVQHVFLAGMLAGIALRETFAHTTADAVVRQVVKNRKTNV